MNFDVFNIVAIFSEHAWLGDAAWFILIVLAFWCTKRYLSLFVIFILKFFRFKEEQVLSIINEELPEMAILIGFSVASERLLFLGQIGTVVVNISKSFVVICFFNIILKLVPVILQIFIGYKTIAIEWLVKLLKGFIIFVSLSTVFGIWNIQVGPIIAGFGLFGAAVAFASKDLFENIISGAILIAENKFKKGDHIRIDDSIEGIVDTIKLRSTKVIRLDRVPVFVPNSKLACNSVFNYSMRDCREIYVEIGVTYSTTVDALKGIVTDISDYIWNSNDFIQIKNDRTTVHVASFEESSINILIVAFSKEVNWLNWLAAKERLMYEVMTIIQKHGSSMAFPSRSVYLETVPKDLSQKEQNDPK